MVLKSTDAAHTALRVARVCRGRGGMPLLEWAWTLAESIVVGVVVRLLAKLAWSATHSALPRRVVAVEEEEWMD